MSKLPLPPGPHIFSLLGSLPEFRKDPLLFSKNMFDRNGDTVSFRFGTIQAIMTKSPEVISHILKKNPENYKKSFAYDLMRPIFGDGLLVAHGDHWKENRIKMQSAFGPEQLKIYGPKIERLTLNLVQEWQKGELRDSQQDIVMLTLGIIGECLFGEDIRSYGPHVSDAMLTIMDQVEHQIMHPLHLPAWVPTQRNKKYQEAIKVIEEIAQKLIDVVLNQPPSPENSKTLLARLMPKEMNPEVRKNLRDQIMTLLITGHDTSANILAFSLQILKKEQQVFEALRSSLDQNDSLDNPMLTAFVNEMMRLYPPVWMASRTALEEDSCQGFRIPKNSLVIFVPYHLHRDEKFWQNPESFNLEHFQSTPKPDTFIPFGAGPRACVAMALGMMEMKIVLRRILLDLNYEIVEGKDIELQPTLTLKPKIRVMTRFSKR